MVWFFHDGSGGWIRFENKLSLANMVFKGSLIPTLAASVPEAMSELADLCKAEGVVDAAPLTKPMSFTALVKYLESLNLLTPTPVKTSRVPLLIRPTSPPGPRTSSGTPSNPSAPVFEPVLPGSGISANPSAPRDTELPDSEYTVPGSIAPPPTAHDAADDLSDQESQLAAAHRAEVLLILLKKSFILTFIYFLDQGSAWT